MAVVVRHHVRQEGLQCPKVRNNIHIKGFAHQLVRALHQRLSGHYPSIVDQDAHVPDLWAVSTSLRQVARRDAHLLGDRCRQLVHFLALAQVDRVRKRLLALALDLGGHCGASAESG